MLEYKLNPDKWVDNYASYLFNYTISRVNDREIAMDLVQDTFVAALKAINGFKGEASERTWLTSILKRKVIDYYRKINSKKGKAEIRLNFNTDNAGNFLEQQIADPFYKTAQDTLENEELGMAIFSCLDKLPEKQMTVFRMKTIENRDTEIICKELNITPSNLWVILHRARQAMIICLEKNWF